MDDSLYVMWRRWLDTASEVDRYRMASVLVRAANECLPSRAHVDTPPAPPPEPELPKADQFVPQEPADRPKEDSGIDLREEMANEADKQSPEVQPDIGDEG